MTFLKWTALGIFAFMATAVSSAQQKFPLRPGEWEVTVSPSAPNAKPVVRHDCLNDETWQKALAPNPTCTLKQLSSSAAGASYAMDCQSAAMQIKVRSDVSFDGMEHMTAKSTVETTLNGQSFNRVALVDYRWKGSVCSPTDNNLKSGNRR